MRCPKCSAENESDAAYCDQCAAPLAAPQPCSVSVSVSDNPPCPACGGPVDDRGSTGVCRSCGLELSAVETADVALQKPDFAEVLSAAIIKRLRLGVQVAEAVSESVAEQLAGRAEASAPCPPAPAFSQREGSCPVCRATLASGAGRCGGCGLYLRADGPISCPNCGAEALAEDGECECGTILTLEALERHFDDSVVLVCVRCKQLYSTQRSACSDCGGRLLSAGPLRECTRR